MKEHAESTPLEWAHSARFLRIGVKQFFVLLVVAPTAIVAFYTLAIASDQYLSSAQYVVRGMQADPPSTGGLGQLLGVGNGLSGVQKEAQSIREYLRSPDAIADLQARGIDVKAEFTRADVDLVSRLRPSNPTAERLLDYYQTHVNITYNLDDGISDVSARAFSPETAQRITKALITLGEQRVNEFNRRAIAAGSDIAEADLTTAELELNEMQRQLTGFRDLTGDLDPLKNSDAAVKTLSEQDVLLARERALYSDMDNYLSETSPQMIAMRNRLKAMQHQETASMAKTTGQPKALARRLAEYEELKLRQQFAVKRYDAARAAVEAAKLQAGKQRIFLIPVVEANLPQRADQPRPLRTILLSFFVCLAAFGIGWLLLAGVREHQA
jgi:capsular polysaccharide transport system permease protein